MSQRAIAIFSVAVVVVLVFLFVCVHTTPNPDETFVTPQEPDIPGFKSVVTPQGCPIPKREPPQATHVTSRMDFKSPSRADMVFHPGITPNSGLSRRVGRDCSYLCDPDGTCASAAFYECLNLDPSRYGTVGRGRVAFNQNFEATSYNQTVSVH